MRKLFFISHISRKKIPKISKKIRGFFFFLRSFHNFSEFFSLCFRWIVKRSEQIAGGLANEKLNS